MGINSRTKGNAGSSTSKVAESSTHKSDSDILVYTKRDTAEWPPLERDYGVFGAGFGRGMRNTPGRGRARTVTSALVNGTTPPVFGRSQTNIVHTRYHVPYCLMLVPNLRNLNTKGVLHPVMVIVIKM